MGLGYVATAASKELGKDGVRLLDAEQKGLSPRGIASILHEYKPQEVGFIVTDPNLPLVFESAKELVDQQPNVKIMFGGPQAILDPKGLMDEIQR